MARSITAGMLTEITAEVMYPAFLVKMQFDAADLNLWTGFGDLSWGGDTYVGAGQLLGISALRETASDVATGMTLTLSGELSSLISTALTEKYMGRTIKCWLAGFDANEAVIADPILIFQGKMDTMGITSSGTATKIEMNSESDLIRLERASLRRFNLQDQQRDYASDLGFEFLPFLADRQIGWGVTPATSQPQQSQLQQWTSQPPPPPPPPTLNDGYDATYEDDGD